MIWLRALPWRLIGVVTLMLAVAFLLWRVNVWRGGYLERDKAVSDLAAYEAAVAARDEQTAKDRAAADARSERLAITLETARATIEQLREHPIVSLVYREKIVNGHSCPDPRIGPDWVGVYNATADAATAAVSAAR